MVRGGGLGFVDREIVELLGAAGVGVDLMGQGFDEEFHCCVDVALGCEQRLPYALRV